MTNERILMHFTVYTMDSFKVKFLFLNFNHAQMLPHTWDTFCNNRDFDLKQKFHDILDHFSNLKRFFQVCHDILFFWKIAKYVMIFLFKSQFLQKVIHVYIQAASLDLNSFWQKMSH